MSTTIYFGLPLSKEQADLIFVKHPVPAAFRAVFKSPPVVFDKDGQKPWVGFEVTDLPWGPLPLKSIAVDPCSETREWWGKFRAFVQHCASTDLGEGELFAVCVDHEED